MSFRQVPTIKFFNPFLVDTKAIACLSAAKQLFAYINKNTCANYGYNQVCKKTMGIKANQAENKAANHTSDDTGNDIAEGTARCFHDSAGNPAGESAVKNG